MRNKRILTVGVVAMAALLLSSVPVMGQAEKTDFTGTLCRTEVDLGTTTLLPSGRVLGKDGWAFYHVFTNDPRVSGDFYSYDVTFNQSPEVPVSCPIAANRRQGLVLAKFILTPDPSSGINGTWEGQWRLMFTIEDGCQYVILTANGKGTGDLFGSTIRVFAKHEFYNLNCATLDANSWPYPLFNGYILTPRK